MVRLHFKLLLLSVALCFCACKNQADKTSELTENANRWYMNASIYNVDVHVFKDSDGDGVGDFNGLTEKLPYLKSLGIDVVWLAPFQPTTNRDDGYDVTDYYSIDPKAGTKQDFLRFVQAAKKLQIKVLMDMVLNHTSIEHPWYQQARADSNSKYHSWYVWSAKRPKDYDKGMAFPGVQTETWTYDQVAKKYYFHRFYDFEPDLNFENKDVQAEARKVITFWLKQGVYGFRLDAVPFMIDRPERGDKNPDPMYSILNDLRQEMNKTNPDAILLGEANVPPKESKLFFGNNSDRLQMMFNFYANQYLFNSLANENAKSFINALQETHDKPQQSQWAYFLRNHDEIDLGRLSSHDRNNVYKIMGPEKNMQLYDRGIRRRLAPMIHNPKKLAMCYAMLYALPGSPVIRYGEEIGMGDDLTLQERLSVRTPMQWNDSLNAGFTTNKAPVRPIVSSGDYQYQKVNVAAQEKDPQSLLNEIKHLNKVRKTCPEIGLGKWKILKTNTDDVLALEYQYQGKSLITVFNFTGKNVNVSVDVQQQNAKLKNVLANSETSVVSANKLKTALTAYGYKWYKVADE
ncbi:alpha-amylase family protein [Mucilaginibacter sp. KACC 22063]|uniref:alpha-amylase family protein n=1 Tax=Mucilaginibacter sp. KACC 22063 TaxID=3025666 RepID=UPI002365333C|nr:alpha-amylase family protein [Mucilaginibacter sp. KACC 22063]WDF56788.1 alpha-amylase family protein [Mucilaginibacter sp. KACC 22063]